MSNIPAEIENRIIAALTELAGRVAETARINVDTQQIPEEIADAIQVGQAYSDSQGQSIEIQVVVGGDNRSRTASAAAYEFGSGIHSTRGPAILYPIDPVRGEYLIFPYEPNLPKSGGWENFQPGPDGNTPDRFVLTHVEHPGVKARPYLIPAVKTHQSELVKLLAKAFLISLDGLSEVIEVRIR